MRNGLTRGEFLIVKYFRQYSCRAGGDGHLGTHSRGKGLIPRDAGKLDKTLPGEQ